MLMLCFLPVTIIWTLAHGQDQGVRPAEQDIGIFRRRLVGANAQVLNSVDPMSPTLGLTQCPRLNCTDQGKESWACSLTSVRSRRHGTGYCLGCLVDLCRMGPGPYRDRRRRFRRLVCRELGICGVNRIGGILDGGQGGINVTVGGGVGAKGGEDGLLEDIGGMLETIIIVGDTDREGNSIILGPANI